MSKTQASDRSLAEKVFHGPLTNIGWWAVRPARPSRLSAEGQHLDRFWAYPPYSLVVMSTGFCGSAAGLLSGIGTLVMRERSLLLCLILLLAGAFVLTFAIGELAENGGGGRCTDKIAPCQEACRRVSALRWSSEFLRS